MFFFFFQAEDGIRDYKVTGVQTCALPIWAIAIPTARATSSSSSRWGSQSPSSSGGAGRGRSIEFWRAIHFHRPPCEPTVRREGALANGADSPPGFFDRPEELIERFSPEHNVLERIDITCRLE